MVGYEFTSHVPAAGDEQMASLMEALQQYLVMMDSEDQLVCPEGCGRSELMRSMEEFSRSRGCDVASVKVFVPNQSAHNLYTALGYSDRMVYCLKPLTKRLDP